jgi:hypothetical protein
MKQLEAAIGLDPYVAHEAVSVLARAECHAPKLLSKRSQSPPIEAHALLFYVDATQVFLP